MSPRPGALGAPIAEHCLRGGARELILVDNKQVTPGVLVRQPYDDDDIGPAKAETLARGLDYAGFRTKVQPLVKNALDVIDDEDATSGIDLIIDATANQTVAEMIELKRWTAAAEWPPVLTVSIGHLAERGFSALALPGATGAGADLIRKLALATHEEAGLADVAEDFFPRHPRTDMFIPEPGCSHATFRGSAAEVQALAAQLFAGVMGDLRVAREAASPPAMTARVVQLSNAAGRISLGATAEFSWEPDVVINDMATSAEEPRYQVRISKTALAAMRDEVSAGRLRFIGMWHTHPYGEAQPSAIDAQTMLESEGAAGGMPPRSLMIILGGPNGEWDCWLAGGDEPPNDCLPQVYAGLIERPL